MASQFGKVGIGSEKLEQWKQWSKSKEKGFTKDSFKKWTEAKARGAKLRETLASKGASRTDLDALKEAARLLAKKMRDAGAVTGKKAEAYERLGEVQNAALDVHDKTPEREVGRESLKTGELITGVRGGRYYISHSSGEKIYVK